jgi:cell division protein FtsB
MRLLSLILLVCFLALQYRLWFGKNSVPDYLALKDEVGRQQQANGKLKQRNQILYAEIDDLKSGLAAVEERARNELGMIKEGETFFRVVPQEKQ